MKKIDPQYIGPNSAQPYKKGTWVHLQESYRECIEAIMRMLAGGDDYDATKLYILYGCVNSGSGLNYDISAGAIFFNGEIYLTDAVTFTATGSDIAVGTITESFYTDATADPVTFTDGVAHNVHSIKKMVWAAGASGSADVDFTNVRNAGEWVISLAIVNPAVSISTGVITFVLFQYKVVANAVHLMFGIGGTLTVAGAAVTARVDMPVVRKFGTVIYGSGVYGDPAQISYAASVIGIAGTNRQQLFITCQNPALTTGVFNFSGQITFAV